MILPFSTSTNIPSGFLVCDGYHYSVSAYSSLYSVIGTTYGTGGAGTFRTPNMTTSTVIPGGIYLTYIIKT
jgi:microcystin-dependent protein